MHRRKIGLHLLVLLSFVITPLLAILPQGQPAEAATGFVNTPFQTVWTRTDQPVEDGSVKRSWLWGDKPLTAPREPYTQAPGGTRQVQYFDKSRMEINNPSTNAVTNGLLATELISGQLQKGDADFEGRQPAQVGIAGDPDDTGGPTYASLNGLLNTGTQAIGSAITETLDRSGSVGDDPAKAGFGVTAAYNVPETGKTIASVFWNFFQTTGAVQVAAGRRTEKIFDPWYGAGGFPITRPYWTRVKVAGDVKDVLVQCFQRRCLTYTPANSEGFKVEMGNIGQHYYKWRYGADPTAGAGPAYPLRRGPGVGFGFNGFFTFNPASDLGSTQRSLNLVTGAGFGWVRQQVVWATLEPTPGNYDNNQLATYDAIVREASTRKLRIMLSVVKSPSWAVAGPQYCQGDLCGLPRDTQTFARLMTFLANRYKPGQPLSGAAEGGQPVVAAFEMWNEQNTGGETGNNIEVGAYIELLKAGYTAVKAVDDDYIVVYGGLTPTGVNDKRVAIDDVNYLEMSYQYNNGEMKRYFDVLGAHPGSNNNAPDQLWPDNPGPGTGCNPPGNCWRDHPSFYFRRIEQLRSVMEKYGDTDKKVWLTEFGWTTQNQAPGYEYGAVISEDLQKQYIVRAFQKGCNEYGWIGVMFLWTLNHSVVVPPSDEKYPWSVLRGDWSPRPAYDAIKAMNKTRNQC